MFMVTCPLLCSILHVKHGPSPLEYTIAVSRSCSHCKVTKASQKTMHILQECRLCESAFQHCYLLIDVHPATRRYTYCPSWSSPANILTKTFAAHPFTVRTDRSPILEALQRSTSSYFEWISPIIWTYRHYTHKILILNVQQKCE